MIGLAETLGSHLCLGLFAKRYTVMESRPRTERLAIEPLHRDPRTPT